jgi:hypothetical protein
MVKKITHPTRMGAFSLFFIGEEISRLFFFSLFFPLFYHIQIFYLFFLQTFSHPSVSGTVATHSTIFSPTIQVVWGGPMQKRDRKK